MAHLNTSIYQVPCTNRGKTYFPSGLREGVFLGVGHDGGIFGMGEFAPFMGIHSHSIADVLSSANSFKKEQLADLFSLDQELTAESLNTYFERFPYPLSYLLSMAHLHGQLKKDAEKTHSRSGIKLSALIEAGSVNDAIILAQGYLAQGFSCLKLKVGSLPLNEEIKKIKTIAAIGGSNVSLRLDTNKRLTLSEAVGLVKELKRVNLEYFEEPLSDINQAKAFYHETGIKVAIDESFTQPVTCNDLAKANIGSIIIKLSRFSTVYQAIALAKEANRFGVEPVFSHCFESEFSSAIVALVIDSLGLTKTAHGILPDGFFKHGMSSEPLRAFRGQLLLDSCKKLIKKGTMPQHV